ncbi:MAG: bifunctional methylenetetrahydrofolate dehydrogenase/methenyltetrahydrofolate cyclohydrolase FolD [Candidatus Margulisbacteria bacterium]|nr:bifunctional methylenetetrahydrofolate dehydrogenase/methenyltetrahydrofolate cyclohydrolase FolD [Candidatus Margulisiibacteriota bacterium]
MVEIINGKRLAEEVRMSVKGEVEAMAAKGRRRPKLSVILVGDDPASQTYVRNKERACKEVGMESEIIRLPADAKQKELLAQITRLNNDKNVDGVLVQLPIPKGLNEVEAVNAVLAEKDVDGLNPVNMGRLVKGEDPMFVSCTPQGIMEMIKTTGVEIKGKEAVVVGRSNIVGKPVAMLLLHQHATVTICHSRTKDLGEVTRRADILIAAVGSPGIIHGSMVKEGALVIDVGTNRVGEKLVGDVDYESAKNRAAFISPVPGGVGPMTIAMLLRNTLKAAQLHGK